MFNFNNNNNDMYKDMALNLMAYLEACQYLKKVPEEDEFWNLVTIADGYIKAGAVVNIEHNELCSNENSNKILTKFNNFVKSMS